jgi:TonB family protein
MLLGRKRFATVFGIVGLLLLSASVLHAEARKVRKYVTPEYPAMALKMKVSGVVTLKATVSSDGRVDSVTVISGHILLKAAASDCVKQWQFEPSSADSVELVAVTFRLPQ